MFNACLLTEGGIDGALSKLFDGHAKSLRNATVFSIQLNHHENRNKIKLTNSLDSRGILEVHTLDFYHCEAYVFNTLKYL